MKKNVFVGIGSVILIVAALIGLGTWLYSGIGSVYYYTQIDNSRISEGKPRDGVIDLQGGMDYSYTLPAYNEKGMEKDITFGASRKLREGAFLQLTVSPIRGVVEWSEAEYEELPEAVQKEYDATE
ncbi:MAG: YxeA family protein [Lachnospiraceae bacterium]|nr:YxeA family protein [Lachnospiraceae bacterium]